MQFSNFALALLSTASVVTSAVTVSFDTGYDNPARSLRTVACSDGDNGLLTAGYPTFGDLPKHPFIGGAFSVLGWNSSNCGRCYQLSRTTRFGGTRTINIIAVDYVAEGFNIAKAAFSELTAGQVSLGRVDVEWKAVNGSVCGLPF